MALIWVQAVVDFTSPLAGEWASGEIDEIDDTYANPLITAGYLIPYVGPLPPSDGAHISGYYVRVDTRLDAVEVTSSGAAQKAANLSDLPSPTTARDNLSVGHDKKMYISFPNGVANQKADVYFTAPNSFFGYVDIDLIGSYVNSNATGKLSATYVLALVAPSTISVASTTCNESTGNIGTHFTLMPIAWDAENSRFKITVAHLTSTGNYIGVRVRMRPSSAQYETAIATLGVGATYTTDTSTPAGLAPWAQPRDADLDAIASLAPANGDLLQRASGAWVNRTPVQVKASLDVSALPATQAMRGLRRALATAGRSVAIQVISDSTGNSDDEWVRLLANSIASEYPAWTVDYCLWNDATQAYGATTRIQTGTAGDLYADFSGTYGRRLMVGAAPHLTGVVDVRAKVTAADWTPAALVYLAMKDLSTGNRSWQVYISNSGRLTFAYSTDGTTQVTMIPGTPLGLTDGSISWVRGVFTPNDGSENRTWAVYTSPDNVTWTQVGTTLVTAGAVTLYDATLAPYWIGSSGLMTSAPGTKVHAVEIRDGVDGKVITPVLPDLWSRYGTAADVPCVGAPVLTVVNGAHPGASLAYHGDATRLQKMTPLYGQVVTLVSDSHNEQISVGDSWIKSYLSYVDALRARLPGTALVGVAQNPQTSASMFYREHRSRRLELLSRQSYIPMIDIYRAFEDYGDWSTFLMTDSVHPNATGQQLWHSTVKAHFDAA